MINLMQNIKYSEIKSIFDRLADEYNPEPLTIIASKLALAISKEKDLEAANELIFIFYTIKDKIEMKFNKEMEKEKGFMYDIKPLLQWIEDNGGSIDYDTDGVI